MSKNKPAAVNHFCWSELATTDTAAAIAFYGPLMGWKAENIPSSLDCYFLMCLGDDLAAALYDMGPDKKAKGFPPHWMAYVRVENADATAAKAVELGGSVVMPPFGVHDVGRMAVLKDPGGAVFAVWQVKRHVGATVFNEPGAMDWMEVMTREPKRNRAFYAGLFGWRTEDYPGMENYTVFQVDGMAHAGMMAMDGPEFAHVPPHWAVYFRAKDADAFVAKAQSLGGTVIVPVTNVPNVGRFAVLQDPQGAYFSILQPL